MEVRLFIIFIYRCRNQETEILLLSKDGLQYEPFFCENENHLELKNKLLCLTGLKKSDFYLGRLLNSCSMITVGKGNIDYKIEASYARVKDTVTILSLKTYKDIKWVKKSEALRYLNYWKGYTHSFKSVFSERETDWECA